jgi:flagellar motor switch protein FliN/FliY
VGLNPGKPLSQLGASTAEAVEGALANAGVSVARGEAVTIGQGAGDAAVAHAIADLEFPAVAAEVSYVDGVSGGNVFLVGLAGARRVAAAMMGGDAEPAGAGDELSELELSAVGEAMNQMMAAAAGGTGSVLGQDVAISPPEIRTVSTQEEAVALLRADGAPHIHVTTFAVGEEAARLVLLVPNAFVVRMGNALESQTTQYTSAPMGDVLRAVPVRVWAELGRARMPAGSSLALPPGSVVELDREVDDPVDLYVDGMRAATGRLLVAEDGSLQLAIDEVFGLKKHGVAADQPGAPTDMAEISTPSQLKESTEV